MLRNKLKSEVFEFSKDDNFQFVVNLGFSDFYTKDNRQSKKRPDLSNCIKLIEDAVFDELGVNDNRVVHISANCYPSKDNHIHVTIRKV